MGCDRFSCRIESLSNWGNWKAEEQGSSLNTASNFSEKLAEIQGILSSMDSHDELKFDRWIQAEVCIKSMCLFWRLLLSLVRTL